MKLAEEASAASQKVSHRRTRAPLRQSASGPMLFLGLTQPGLLLKSGSDCRLPGCPAKKRVRTALVALALALAVPAGAAIVGFAPARLAHADNGRAGWKDPYPAMPTHNDPAFVGTKWRRRPMVDGNRLEYLAQVPRGNTTAMPLIVIAGGAATLWRPKGSTEGRSSSLSARARPMPIRALPTMAGCSTG